MIETIAHILGFIFLKGILWDEERGDAGASRALIFRLAKTSGRFITHDR